MKTICYVWLILFVVNAMCTNAQAHERPCILVLTERGGQHKSFTDSAMVWLDAYAMKNGLEIVEVNDTQRIDRQFLSRFNLFIQLDFPPYTWGDTAQAAFIDYIENGRGGWIGFHHATLLGDFDGYPMWQWFSDFMGGIRFQNYIAKTASATVNVEDTLHPVTKGVPLSLSIPDDEWYTFNASPRPNVHVLASVDESTYQPPSDVRMGDHPVVWVNEKMNARNVYFLMGHSGSLFSNAHFTTLFSNAIGWTLGKQ